VRDDLTVLVQLPTELLRPGRVVASARHLALTLVVRRTGT
jgi:hypothetical protein